MSNLKDVSESISVVSSKFKLLAAWASTSRKRYILALLIIGIPILAVEGSLVFLLLPQYQKDSERHISRVDEKHRENDYDNALDAVNACISAKSPEPASVEWYCNNAIERYKQLHAVRLPSRVDDVVNRKAYLAMREDIKNDLRFIDLLRVENEPPTLSQKILQITIYEPVLTVWMLTIFLVLYSFGRLVKKHQRINSSVTL
jgi:hypothetical protein